MKDARAVNIMLNALKDKQLDIIAKAYAFFIRRGIPGTENLLVESLHRYVGIPDEIEDFLNCGNSKLEEAAKLLSEDIHLHFHYDSNRPPAKRERPLWGQDK